MRRSKKRPIGSTYYSKINLTIFQNVYNNLYCSTSDEPTLDDVHVALDNHCQFLILVYLNDNVNGTSTYVVSLSTDAKEAF